MMHKWLIGLLAGGVAVHAFGQTFNLRHDLFQEGSWQSGWGVEMNANGDAMVVFNGSYVQDSLFYSSGVSSVVVNAMGEFSEGFRLHVPERATYPGWANCVSPRAEGGYIVGGGTQAVGDTHRVALYWMDAEGLVINFRELDLPGRAWIGRQGKQAPDGGFVACGETSTVGYVDAFLVKTDPLGEVEWVNTYGGPLWDGAMAVDNIPGGGYYLGGQYRTTSVNKDLWVQALNDTGGVRWNRVWGSPFDEMNAHLITTSDGHATVASAWGMGAGGLQKKYMAKLDSANGSLLWERQYGPSQVGTLLYTVKEVEPYGDLIAVGHSAILGDYNGTLLRTTSIGDSLWMRNYQYHDSLVSNGRGILRDVVPVPDGGFIAVGMAFSVPSIYSQDVWVIKTDSMGCLEPGCHLITGMETQITNLGGALRVWPNPVAAGTPVQVELQLPEGFVVQGQLRLTVTDAAGRVVREEHFTPHTSQLTLHTSLPPGLYHLHLHDNTRWIAGAKLIVQ